MNRTHTGRRPALCAAALLIAAAVFAAPDRCLQEATAGLRACGRELLFGIFPFLVVSNLIVTSGCAALLALPLRPLARLLGCRTPAGAVILLLGALGGFAPAAAAAAGLVRSKTITPQEGERMLTAAAGSSPSFVILAVGGQMLGSTELGVRLYLCQLLASYGSVLIMRAITALQHPKGKKPAHQFASALPQNNLPCEAGLCSAISDAAVSYVKLCGFIVLFRMLTGAAAVLLPQKWCVLPAMLLEVSTGCSTAAGLPHSAVYGCCAALSLQGASVLLQIRSLCPAELSVKPLVYSRPLHLVLALAALRLCFSSSRSAEVYCSLESRLVALPRLTPEWGLLLFLICLLVCDQLCRTLQRCENRL